MGEEDSWRLLERSRRRGGARGESLDSETEKWHLPNCSPERRINSSTSVVVSPRVRERPLPVVAGTAARMLVVTDDAMRVRLRLIDPQPAGDVVSQPRDLRGDLGGGARVPSRPRDAAASTAAGDLTSDALPEAESAPFAVLVLVA